MCSQWEVEDWVTIVYDKQLYPGVIADVSDSGILVDCMKGLPGKNCFRWPPKKDTLIYSDDEVLCKVDPPSPINRRGDYSLTSMDFAKSNYILNERILNE